VVMNDTRKRFEGILGIDLITLGLGKSEYRRKFPVGIDGGSVQRFRGILHSQQLDLGGWCAVFSLWNHNGALISRNFFLPGRWKFQKLAKAAVKIKILPGENSMNCILTTDRAAFFVDAVSENVRMEPRGFILLPGEEKRAAVTGRQDDPAKSPLVCLNDYLA